MQTKDVTPALFSPTFLELWVILNKNPRITKQLDQKPPVMQQGSVAHYLLPRWEMEGESACGWEGPRDGNKGGRTAREQVWLTDSHISSSFFGLDGLHRTSACLKAQVGSGFVSFAALGVLKFAVYPQKKPRIVSIKVLDVDCWSLILMLLIPLPGGFVHKAS